MEIASMQLNSGLPPVGQKRSKKQAKLLQQRMEHLARINIHLQGKERGGMVVRGTRPSFKESGPEYINKQGFTELL